MPDAPVVAVRAAVGFFGKLPSRGDFLRAGLPRGFTDPWDDWLQQAISGSREVLGEIWLAAWMEAPIWHFALPAGQCGAAPVLGVWMPSVDAAGRHFPLTLAHVGDLPVRPGDWLAAAEAIGLEALQYDLDPEAVARRLADPVPESDAATPDLTRQDGALWWTEGSPFVPPRCWHLGALPDAATFAAMLHAAPDRAVSDQPDGPPDAGGVGE